MRRGLDAWTCGFGDSQTPAHPRQVGESSELERETAGANGSHIGGLALCLSRLEERKVGERGAAPGAGKCLQSF